MEKELFSLKIYKDGIALIELNERLARESVIAFRQRAVSYIEDNKVDNLIIDLTNLNWIDSAGIGVLMVIFKLINNKNGVLVFVNPNKQISEIFSILKLNQIFQIVDSVEAAADLIS